MLRENSTSVQRVRTSGEFRAEWAGRRWAYRFGPLAPAPEFRCPSSPATRTPTPRRSATRRTIRGGPGLKNYSDTPDEQRLAPDDPRKPGSPTDLDKKSWFGVAKRAFTEFKEDNITDWAAALTYYGVLSMFPALIALVSVMGLFGQIPHPPRSTLTDIVTARRPGRRGHPGRTDPGRRPGGRRDRPIVGLAAALWSASGFIGAFIRAANIIYETPEGRRI